MQEKAYKAMGKTGATNLVIGICVLAGGIVSGILLIIHGAMLLSERKKLQDVIVEYFTYIGQRLIRTSDDFRSFHLRYTRN